MGIFAAMYAHPYGEIIRRQRDEALAKRLNRDGRQRFYVEATTPTTDEKGKLN